MRLGFPVPCRDRAALLLYSMTSFDVSPKKSSERVLFTSFGAHPCSVLASMRRLFSTSKHSSITLLLMSFPGSSSQDAVNVGWSPSALIDKKYLHFVLGFL